MAFYKWVCRQCGHTASTMTFCRRTDCELAERDDLASLHYHCHEGCECTTAGCQTDRVRLGTGGQS